jgi:hypothetical protein
MSAADCSNGSLMGSSFALATLKIRWPASSLRFLLKYGAASIAFYF